MNTAIDSDDGNPALRAHAREALREWLGYLEDLVCQATLKGEIEAGTSPSSIASIIIATLEGSLMMSRITNYRTAMTHAREHLHKMLEGVTVR